MAVRFTYEEIGERYPHNRSGASSSSAKGACLCERRIVFFAFVGLIAAILSISGCSSVAPPPASLSLERPNAFLAQQAGSKPPAPTGTIPNYSPTGPGINSDITCRPTLAGYPTSDSNPIWKEARVDPMRAIGICKPLSPVTRLLLEDASASSNYAYSNQVGLQNGLATNPSSTLQVQATNMWQLGLGYTNKPILKELRALAYPWDEREATAHQGTFLEDFFWDAIGINASISYGRALAKTNGVLTDAFTTRPFYSVGATYSLDLERMWVYAAHPGSRPGDPGYC